MDKYYKVYCNGKEKAAIMLAIQAIVDMVYTLHPQN